MANYGILGTPMSLKFEIEMTGDIEKGEKYEYSKQLEVADRYEVPSGHLFVIESVGIYSSLQQNDKLYPSIHSSIREDKKGGLIYPIALLGANASHNVKMPLRRFGSQQLLLYANEYVNVSAIRSNDVGEVGRAYIMFNISGRLLGPA